MPPRVSLTSSAGYPGCSSSCPRQEPGLLLESESHFIPVVIALLRGSCLDYGRTVFLTAVGAAFTGSLPLGHPRCVGFSWRAILFLSFLGQVASCAAGGQQTAPRSLGAAPASGTAPWRCRGPQCDADGECSSPCTFPSSPALLKVYPQIQESSLTPLSLAPSMSN